MKFNTLLFAFIISASSFVFGQKSAVKGKKIKPKHHVGIVKMQSKKTITYYALSTKERTELVVMGPGKIEVLLRVRLEDTTKRSLPYVIQHVLDDKKMKVDTLKGEKVSKHLKYKNVKLLGRPSAAGKVYIHVPPGQHIVKVYKGDTEQKVHAEFKYFKDKNAPSWRNIKPVLPLDTVRVKYLTKKANIKTFHRISNERKFVLNTTDSTQLKIIIKAELDYKDQSGKPIILTVKEKGVVIKSYKISGKKSQKTEYVDEKKLIPGNSNVIYLNLPKGNHRYEFSLEDKKKTAIILIDYNTKLKRSN
jgi:hypothetical protein